jgi:hypothetical protein
MGSYGVEKVSNHSFSSSPLARAIALSLGMPANQATGTAGRRGGGAAGASASQPPRSLSTRPADRPRFAFVPPSPIKTNKPLSSHHHHPSNRFIIIKTPPQPSKPTSNLRPENPWSLSMTSDQKPKGRLETTTNLTPTSQLATRTSSCEIHRTTLLLLSSSPGLLEISLQLRRNNEHRTTIETHPSGSAGR